VDHVEGCAGQMRVACSGTGTLVAKEFLDHAQRHPLRSEMRGIRVPKRVNRGVFGKAALTHHARQGLLQGGRRERRLPVPSGEQPGSGACPLPVHPSQLQCPFGQGHQTIFAPLTLSNTDQHALRINIRDLSLRPFSQAQPTRRDQLQTHTGVRAWHQGQQGAHCLRTQHDGELLAVPGTNELEDGPWALQRALVEAANPLQVETSRALCHLLPID
jgi:hypothetical protein